MSRSILKISAIFLFAVLIFIAGFSYVSARYMERQQQQQAAGNLNGAIGAASAAARFDPFEAAPLQAQSSILYGRGRNASAKEFMEQAALREPNEYVIQLSLGNIEMEMGEFEAAEQSYREAERLNPFGGLGTEGLAQALLRQDELEEAGTAYQRIADMGDLGTMGYYNLGRIQVRTGDPEEGTRNINRAIRRAERELRTMNGEARQSQMDLIESMNLAAADGLVVQSRYNAAYQILAESTSNQAPALLQLISTDPEGYRDSVIDSDVY